MAVVIIFFILSLGLTIVFPKVNEWFQNNKKINIIPAALIETIAEVIFIFNYESKETKAIILTWVAIAIVLVIIVFNLIKYGFKNGALASLAELVFSIAIAFIIVLIVCYLMAISDRNKKRKK